MLTVRTSATDAVESLKAGADDFMSKPFTEESLRARVRLLARKRAALTHVN
jgi:DNA-binding response OmpR family regulator